MKYIIVVPATPYTLICYFGPFDTEKDAYFSQEALFPDAYVVPLDPPIK